MFLSFDFLWVGVKLPVMKSLLSLLFSFQLFLIGLKYEQMRKNIILQNILTL